MVFFTDDIWAIILVCLPLKNITASKSVCKQWKSIVESSFLRELFLTRHQNSQYSSWSLMCNNKNKNDTIHVLADYGCEIWGLQRSLNSYIYSFITNKFLNHRKIYKHAKVVAYSDVGLVLIQVVSIFSNVYYYVANPISHECVETDPSCFTRKRDLHPLGIATRIDENGVLSGYKVVLLYDAMSGKKSKSLSLLIYSSETGLWSLETVHFPFAVSTYSYENFISSKGNLHWLTRKSNYVAVVVSIDFYSVGTDRCRVTPFPDLGKVPKFGRVCTTCQGFFTYMSVTKDDESVGERLSVWSLKSGEWQLVSQITRDNGFYDIPLALNPFDANSAYFWSRYGKRLLLLNLHNGKFMRHNKFESSGSGRISRSIEGVEAMTYIKEGSLASFILPQWLHRIPNMVKKN